MKKMHFKEIINSNIQLLLIGMVFLFAPMITVAQVVYYATDQRDTLATSNSRMVATIEETEDHVMIHVMALGRIMFDGFNFVFVYDTNSLTLMDNTLTNKIPLTFNGINNVGSIDPSFSSVYRYFSTVALNHQIVTSGDAVGMKYINTGIVLTNPDLSHAMSSTDGKMIPVYTLYFNKRVPGVDLETTDLGFYYNFSIPRTFSSWVYTGTKITYGPSSSSDNHYPNPNLFVYRSSSVITTHPANNVAGTSITLNGHLLRGKFAAANDMIVSGMTSATKTGRLNYDTITQYGFIYSLEDVEITSNNLSDKLIIDGTPYNFPDAGELAAGTFVRNGNNFNIVFSNNTTADQARSYNEDITGLIQDTTYYAWAVMKYAFETSDVYVALGAKETFMTTSNCIPPDAPIAISNQSFCNGATVADLVAFLSDTLDLIWYNNDIMLGSTDVLIDGELYYAKASFEGCESVDSMAVVVNIIGGLNAPTVTTPQIFCQGSLVSDLRAREDNIIWYDAVTGGNIVNPSDLLVNGFYYAALKADDCESDIRSQVKVIIDEIELDAPAVASPQNFCDYATLADIATDGSNIIWYSAGGALLPSTTVLSNATVYYAAYAAGICESVERTPVLVYTGMNGFIDAPVITSPQRFCEGASIQSISVPNNKIIWYATATGNTEISSNTILSHDIIYYAAQKAGECESTERTPVRVLFDNPQGPEAVSPQAFCGTNFTLADLKITGAGIVWYDASTGGNLLPSTTALTTTPTWYYAAQSAVDCETSRVGILAYASAMPATPVISGDLIVCTDEETMDLTSVVVTESNIVYIYYFDKGITEIKDPENVPVPAQDMTYYVKATSTSTECESQSLGEIDVTISNPPVVSLTPAGAYTAVNDSIVLIITDNNTNQAVGSKTVTILDESIASVQLVNGELKVIGKTRGNTEVVYASVNEDGCTTELIIPVQIEGLPTGILTGNNIVVCGEDTTAIVQIAYVMGGVAPWIISINDDRGLFSVDTVINSIDDFPVNIAVRIPENISGIPEYTTYVISNIEDAFGSNKQTHYGAVRIGVNPTPVINDIANKYQVLCSGEATLPISFAGVATIYRWSIDSNIGIANYSDGVIPSFITKNETGSPITATITVTPEYWYNGLVCIGETDTAVIILNPAVKANFVTAVTGLGTIQFTDRSSTTVTGWSWDFGDGSTSTDVNPIHTYTASGTYSVVLTVTTDDGCIATAIREVKVIVSTNIFADFSINNNTQCLSGNDFLFTNKSTVSTEGHHISAWSWDFGDGNTSTDKNPSHTYNTAGIYIVTLTVTEMPGASKDSIRYQVSVIDAPEITDGAAPEAVCIGEKLRVSTPTIDWKGNTPVTGQWLLDSMLFDPNTTSLTYADNGKLLQYRVETPCGIAISQGVTVTVYGAPEITLESSLIEICDDIAVVKIPYTVNVMVGTNIYYSIVFDANARRAGFIDVSNELLTDDTIRISIPAGLLDEYYGGVLSVQADNGCQNMLTYPFDIHKAGRFTIIQQPVSLTVCNATTISLSVVASAANLNYQWYRGGVAISGANSSVYTFDYDANLSGEYYVEVSNNCMTVTSAKANIGDNHFAIQMKWDNMIYINNPGYIFVSFQWYKDGKRITTNGQSSYYGEEYGFDGTYYVRCYYPDGSYIETCPVTLNTKKSTKVLLYPNPAEAGSRVVLEIYSNEYDITDASLEIFDAAGKLISRGVITSSVTEITAPMAAGIYIAKVTTKTKHIFVERFAVSH